MLLATDYLLLIESGWNFNQIKTMREIGQIFIITVGVAGCGKTTYVKKRFPNFYRISMDEIRGQLSLDPADSEQSQLAFRCCYPLLQRALSGGKSIVWDATSLTTNSRKQLIQSARRFGFRVVIIYFDIPLEEILRRNSQRRRKVPDSAILCQWKEIEPPQKNEADELIIIKKS